MSNIQNIIIEEMNRERADEDAINCPHCGALTTVADLTDSVYDQPRCSMCYDY